MSACSFSFDGDVQRFCIQETLLITLDGFSPPGVTVFVNGRVDREKASWLKRSGFYRREILKTRLYLALVIT